MATTPRIHQLTICFLSKTALHHVARDCGVFFTREKKKTLHLLGLSVCCANWALVRRGREKWDGDGGYTLADSDATVLSRTYTEGE